MFFLSLTLSSTSFAKEYNDEIGSLIASLITNWKDSNKRKTDIVDRKFIKWQRSVEKSLHKIESNFGDLIQKISRENKMNPKVTKAVILVESSGDPRVCSKSDACGLMQLKKEAAGDVGVYGDLKDPSTNLQAGTKYLVSLCSRYKFCKLDWRLIAYKDGPGTARKLKKKGVDPSNHPYVKKVIFALEEIKRKKRLAKKG